MGFIPINLGQVQGPVRIDLFRQGDGHRMLHPRHVAGLHGDGSQGFRLGGSDVADE